MIFEYLFWGFSALVLGFALYQLLFAIRILFKLASQDGQTNVSNTNECPKITVIVPVKGADVEFEENLKSFFSLDYQNYDLIFVTADQNDPARKMIERLKLEFDGQIECQVLTAGYRDGCAEKLANLAFAVERLPVDDRILVFFDGDIRLNRQVLSEVALKLKDESVGAVTGFPLFRPSKRLSSWVRWAWGVGGLIGTFDPKARFVHGAINAIRLKDFKNWGLIERYRKRISDSFEITNAVRENSKSIELLSFGFVVSPDDSSWSMVFAWSNRLKILSRAYYRPLWNLVAYSYGGLLGSFLGLFIVFWLSEGNDLNFRGIWVFAVFVSILGSFFIVSARAAGTAVKDDGTFLKLLSSSPVKVLLAGCIAMGLIVLNIIVSLFVNEFVWRHVRYRISNSGEVTIVDRGS